MRFAYADPPYLGCCGLYDHEHGDDGRCWDDPETHRQLIDALVAEFPDGWALSMSAPGLLTLAPMLPRDVRIGSWVKTFVAFKKGVRPCYAWEPVIFWRGRNPKRFPHAPPAKGGKQNTPKDFVLVEDSLVIAEPITLRKGLTGAKPERVCAWILDLLNVQPGDEVVDLYPGTGVMGEVAAKVTNRANGDEDAAPDPVPGSAADPADFTTTVSAPHKVTQTILYDPELNARGVYGNCLQAAFASLLGMPLEAVPHFVTFESWDTALALWLGDIGLVRVVEERDSIPTTGLCIVSGRSPRGVRHSVVAIEGEVWDPHPSRAGLESVNEVWWFEPCRANQEEAVSA